MRLRVGLVLCLFLAFLGSGCRKALEPNVDTNQAPETWITAAPQDTITTRTPQGVPIDPTINRIPVRFHIYWAGADKDGAVAGFYWAVVETLATPPGDGLPLPNLPGPKAHDYHFTTKTDSIFIFTASEDVPERQHAFFIYAVDNKGKPDPTPARFIFRAYDRFPPLAIIDQAKAVGTTYTLTAGGVTPHLSTYFITDSFDLARAFPRDTVPSGALLSFKWHGEVTIPSGTITGFRYKLDETNFNVVDTTVRSVVYNTGVGADVIQPGNKIFTLRAVDQSGWRGQSTRWFQMNFAPDTWFSGPDVTDPAQGWSSTPDRYGKPRYYKYIPDWTPGVTQGVPNTLFSGDSVQILPARRVEKRTFFEIYGDTIFAHVEGDTVNLNSWLVFGSGGVDKDSPYKVQVGIYPNLPVGPVTTIVDSANGSPIGFRAQVITHKPNGSTINPTLSTIYPVFDVSSVFLKPDILSYWDMNSSGRCYAYAAAVDGDNSVDGRVAAIGGPDKVVDDIETRGGTPDELAVRSKVIALYVNHPPFFKNTPTSQFTPKPNTQVARTGSFNMIADDADPIDYGMDANPAPGGPQGGHPKVLVKYLTVTGTDSTGASITVTLTPTNGWEPDLVPYSIPTSVVPGPITLHAQLSDFRVTDADSHPGRTISIDIPLILKSPSPFETLQGASPETQRPGSPQAVGRRQ